MQYLNINMQTIYEKKYGLLIYPPVKSITLVLTSMEDSGLPQNIWNIHVANIRKIWLLNSDRLSVMLTFSIAELNILYCSL